MTGIVKDTRQRYVQPNNSGDIQLDAQGPEALSQEIIPLVGGWMDWTGSGGVPTKQLTMMPHADELMFTNAWLEGARKPQLGALGQNIRTTRLRRKKILIG